jgi:hypothetical protein
MRVAIIEAEYVINVIVSDNIPDNAIECDENVCPGWTYVDGEFIAPPINYYVPDDEAETI